MSALKYLGIFILLIGVAVLAVPAVTGGLTNTHLLVGLFLVVGGYLGHIALNKKFES
ncbi:MAG: hypothetical protein LBT76_07540 [Tannerella sp.]|jgi:uncharacterized membrane protein HdeD (DUF308 family)|nr:hypothetical protein [Tannerella sp.]